MMNYTNRGYSALSQGRELHSWGLKMAITFDADMLLESEIFFTWMNPYKLFLKMTKSCICLVGTGRPEDVLGRRTSTRHPKWKYSRPKL